MPNRFGFGNLAIKKVGKVQETEIWNFIRREEIKIRRFTPLYIHHP
jgi:hypothetical protein